VTFVPDRPSTRVPRTEPLKRLLAERGLTLKKRWGQHFCLDQNLLHFLVRTADPLARDLILEIGPGLGHLTRVLSPACGQVVAVEIDRGLVALLRERLADLSNVTLIEGDVLAVGERLSPQVVDALRAALPGLPGAGLLVVSNLPYAVAATVILALLESGLPIARMVVMMQKEVAERLAASPGDPAYGLTSVLVQAKAGVHVRRRVPPEVFWPRPRVPSAIAVITPGAGALGGEEYLRLKRVAKAVFLHRRKTVGASIRLLGEAGKTLSDRREACRLDPGTRVDELTLEDFRCLAGLSAS
jgi:16S rRNA (adenine1518-N6/adenine1519-N6)-dimethyltransferase